MGYSLFSERIETDWLVFERASWETVGPFELYEFASRSDRQGAATEHRGPDFGFSGSVR
jgi:hypothetical protein